MSQYGILVVDDSAFMRRGISEIIEKDPRLKVIGIARDGEEALEKVKRLKPDLVTMDVEMPKMNGIKALQRIMVEAPVPVVMLSSLTKEGAKETIQALEHGAVDFYLKDTLLKKPRDPRQIREFLERILGIVAAKQPKQPKKPIQPEIPESQEIVTTNTGKIDLLFIGCSTGGPSALQTILPQLPADFPVPVVVAQHMPKGFTKHLAERFKSLCKLKVAEAVDGQILKRGEIYIAPSGYQTRVAKNRDDSVYFVIDDDENSKELYKPSVDVTLDSLAPIYQNGLLSVILTGMGVDGMKGCATVKKFGGHVFVEAEESCIVYGMPKAVKEAGHADKQYHLSKMTQEILAFV